MTIHKHAFIARIRGLAKRAKQSQRSASVVLSLLASAIEDETVDGLAEAAIEHATKVLIDLKHECDLTFVSALTERRDSD